VVVADRGGDDAGRAAVAADLVVAELATGGEAALEVVAALVADREPWQRTGPANRTSSADALCFSNVSRSRNRKR
jgi:hypothetical protein